MLDDYVISGMARFFAHSTHDDLHGILRHAYMKLTDVINSSEVELLAINNKKAEK